MPVMNAAVTCDEALFDFYLVADPVTPDLVTQWTTRYPQFADDIRAHALKIIAMEQRAEDINRLATEG